MNSPADFSFGMLIGCAIVLGVLCFVAGLLCHWMHSRAEIEAMRGLIERQRARIVRLSDSSSRAAVHQVVESCRAARAARVERFTQTKSNLPHAWPANDPDFRGLPPLERRDVG